VYRTEAPARATSRANQSFNLQQKLIRWSRDGDYLTAERVCQHVLMVAETGASKSTAMIDLAARSVFEAGFGAFVHTAKITAAEQMIRLAEQSGVKRIIYWGPGSGERFNWADYEYHDFGDGKGRVDNLMAVFKTMVEVYMRSSGQKESEPFWQFMNEQGMTNLFFIDGEANNGIDLSRMLEYWQSIPRDFDDLCEPEESASLTALMEAEVKCPPEKRRSLQLSRNWLLKQMPALNERTKSCVVAMAIGMLDPHARDIMQEAMGGQSTWTPETICDGAVVVCGYDVKRFGAIGKLIQVAAAKSVERKIERRLAEFNGNMDGCRPVALIADEAQFFMHSGQLDFLRTAREAKGAAIWSIQSLPSVVHELGGGAVAENEARATFGMFQTKIYGFIACDVTSEQCARWIGQDMQRRPGGSTGVDDRGRVNRGDNWSEVPYYIVPPIAFQRLPRGGEAEKWNVRPIVTMAGYPWKCNDGKYWAKIKLFQNIDKAKILWLRWPWAPIWMWLDKVPSARCWSLHVRLFDGERWHREYRRKIEAQWREKPITSEWEFACLWWGVTKRHVKRWWAFWVDDRATLLGVRNE
jgi:hypothetical protein